ncbi:MAG: TAXI family TRAP transporter solute-binding subunit [Caulobacteraceae bacterium]
MKKIRKSGLVLLACILVASMILGVGCAPKKAETAPAAAAPAATSEAKVEIPKKVFAVGSASAGSLFVTYTAAWSNMLMQKIPGLNMTVEPGGSSQNMQTIDSGDTDFGITSTFQTYPGYYGLTWAKGTKYQKVNSLFPSYSYEGVWFTTAEHKDINSIKDLDGKIISFGYAGGGSDFTGRELVDYFGIKPKEIVNANWDDVGGMLADGLVDAVFYLAGHPASFIQELELQHPLKFFGFSDEELKKFQDDNPYYNVGILKSGTYKAMTTDYKALQGWNFIACSPDLPEDFVYELVKTTWENVDAIHNAHASFIETDLKNVKYMNLPLHPGAKKYYEEKGVELPVLPPPPKN